MMEMAGWGGTEIKTLQFLLPADIHQVKKVLSSTVV